MHVTGVFEHMEKMGLRLKWYHYGKAGESQKAHHDCFVL